MSSTPAGGTITTRTSAAVGAVGTVLDRTGDLLFRLPLWALGGLLLAMSALKNGIWHTPNLVVFLEIVRHFPEPPPPGPGAYLLSSPLGAAVASALHLDGALAFVLLHLGVVLVSSFGVVLLVRRRFGDLAARVTLVALFCSPLSNLLLTWLGQPDAFTFASASALVVLRSPLLLLAAAAVLGVNHFEQGVFIVLAAAALRVKEERRNAVAVAGAMVLGLVAGRLALLAYHHRYAITSGGVRWDVATTLGLSFFFAGFAKNFPAWLFSIFNALWVFLTAVYLRHRRELLVPLGVLVAFVLPALVSFDQTRVYALVTWPVVLWTVLWACRNEEEALIRRLATIAVLLGLLLPRVMVWEGRIYTSSLRLLVNWLLS